MSPTNSDIPSVPPVLATDKDLNDFGSELVREAGALLLDYHGKVDFKTKKNAWDLVSDADHASEKLIFEACRKKYPEWKTVGEESVAEGQDTSDAFEDYCWICDPLDGTLNYAAGLPYYATSLGLFYKGEPLVAWIYAPVMDELYHAQKGNGAYLNGQSLDLSKTPIPPTWGASQPDLFQPYGFKPIPSLKKKCGKLRIYGSQALQLCQVAVGQFACNLCSASLWDEAAGALIVTEAGGHYSKPNGEPQFPLPPETGKTKLPGFPSVAAHPAIAEDILNILSSTLEEQG